MLREVAEGDLAIFFEDQADPVAVEMAAFSSRDRDAFTAHWARILADETVLARTIVFEGKVAGNVVSFVHGGEREVGYWIGRELWGRGVATRALQEFLGEVNARPLFARVARRNLASIRVLEKCGFTICGEERTQSGAHGEEVEELLLRLDSVDREGSR